MFLMKGMLLPVEPMLWLPKIVMPAEYFFLSLLIGYWLGRIQTSNKTIIRYKYLPEQ